jgi:polyhydroxyalkanoate synthesis regulator phasin
VIVKQGSVPIPDPTKLTTDAVAAAKAEIEKLFDEKLSGSRQLISEKFEGVKTEFTMRDIALAAAFKAAEAAVKQQNESNTLAIDKAGTAFTKQIDGLDEKIDDLKERISALAGRNWAAVGAYIVGALGIAALIAAVLVKR